MIWFSIPCSAFWRCSTFVQNYCPFVNIILLLWKWFFFCDDYCTFVKIILFLWRSAVQFSKDIDRYRTALNPDDTLAFIFHRLSRMFHTDSISFKSQLSLSWADSPFWYFWTFHAKPVSLKTPLAPLKSCSKKDNNMRHSQKKPRWDLSRSCKRKRIDSRKITNGGRQVTNHNQPLFSRCAPLSQRAKIYFESEEENVSFFVNLVRFDSFKEKPFRLLQNHSFPARGRRKVKSMDPFDSICCSEFISGRPYPYLRWCLRKALGKFGEIFFKFCPFRILNGETPTSDQLRFPYRGSICGVNIALVRIEISHFNSHVIRYAFVNGMDSIFG
jgi:hypothetical protein